MGQPSTPRMPCNEPFGSRPEPGVHLIVSILLSPPGEAPEGGARGHQDTASRVQSESEVLKPAREPGVTGKRGSDQRTIAVARL